MTCDCFSEARRRFDVDGQEFARTILDLFTALIPIAGVVGVFAAYSYYERRKKVTTKDDEKVYAALDKLWPLITTEVTATMVTQQPASYFVVSKLMAERQAAKSFKEIK